MPKPQKIAFPFVLEELAPINPIVKAMFGCHAIYDGRSATKVLGGGPDSNWQNLPLDNPRFEELALDLCQLVLKNDPLIGRNPQSKKSKKAR